MKWELHPQQSELSRALYVVRLRHGPFRSGDRWIRRSVAQRRAHNEHEMDGLKPKSWHPKRWQPPEGRESPREELMGLGRRCSVRYAYPGAMRYLHGKGPPLIGRSLLYDPFAPREAWRHPLYD